MASEMNVVHYNCAVGIIFNLMRMGMLSTAEYDMVAKRLQEKYGISEQGAE